MKGGLPVSDPFLIVPAVSVRSGEVVVVRGAAYEPVEDAAGSPFAPDEFVDVFLKDYPAVKRWYDEIAARPAVQRGLAVLSEHQRDVQISDAEREITFGATQFAVR